MLEQTVQIVSHERDAESYFRLVLRAPGIAPLIQPGQFAHVRILPLKDALLRRPFSIFQVAGDTFSILYKNVGKGTDALSRMRAGEELNVIAPLGHGFTVPPAGGETPLLVAGGYGMAAMFLLAHRSPQKGIVFVGGRRRVDILCEKDFAAIGWEVRVATEDGSHGEKGFVTVPLLAEIQKRRAESGKRREQTMVLYRELGVAASAVRCAGGGHGTARSTRARAAGECAVWRRGGGEGAARAGRLLRAHRGDRPRRRKVDRRGRSA